MHAIGIDLGGTKILIGLIDQNGNVINPIKKQTPKTKKVDEIMGLTFETIEQVIAGSKIDRKAIRGIGVAAPGIVDQDKGILLYAPNWNMRNLEIRKILKKKYSLPVNVANDVNAAAFGELHFGHGRNEDSFFWMTVSTGIGGALVIDRKVVLGNKGLAGEIGHMIIDENGPLCKCERKGCLEAFSSGTAIASLAKKRIKNGVVFQKLDPEIKPDEITSEAIVRAAFDGDRESILLLEEAARNISKALSYVVNLTDIELLVIGGGVMENSDLLFSLIDKNMKTYVYEYQQRNVRLVRPKLGYNSSLIGAGALVLKK